MPCSHTVLSVWRCPVVRLYPPILPLRRVVLSNQQDGRAAARADPALSAAAADALASPLNTSRRRAAAAATKASATR
eukprot:scaffold66412_cov51-Phaeocystis_antarctica.AAC.1